MTTPKTNPGYWLRCPICRAPQEKYSLMTDKCYCTAGHAYNPGESVKQEAQQTSADQAS